MYSCGERTSVQHDEKMKTMENSLTSQAAGRKKISFALFSIFHGGPIGRLLLVIQHLQIVPNRFELLSRVAFVEIG